MFIAINCSYRRKREKRERERERMRGKKEERRKNKLLSVACLSVGWYHESKEESRKLHIHIYTRIRTREAIAIG